MDNRKIVKVLTLDDFDLKDKTVFLRVDMNCPIDPETMEITGTKRIEEVIETIESLKESKTQRSKSLASLLTMMVFDAASGENS